GADLSFSASPPARGTLGPIDNTPMSSALVTFTPPAGYTGTDSFVFTAAAQLATSLSASVTITVAPADAGAPPVISPVGPAVLAVLQNSSATNAANRLSFTATDPDSPTGLVWSISGPAAHGTALIASGSPSNSGGAVIVSYAPTTSYLGA